MDTTKKIIYLDASAIKQSACFLRFWNVCVEGYRESINSIDIEYGQAFHLFVKTIKLNNGDLAAALKTSREYFRNTPYAIKEKKMWLTEAHLIETCLSYWTQVGENDDLVTLVNPTDKVPFCECKFSLPLYEDDNVIIILCGTVDDLCVKTGGCYVIRDYKTTSVWDVKNYLGDYALDAQMLTYRYAIKRYSQLYPDSIYTELHSKNIRVLIQGVFLKKDGATFERSEAFEIKEDRLNEYEQMLGSLVSRIVEQLTTYKDMAIPREGMFNGSCGTKYGHCNFFNACNSFNETARQHVIKNTFIVKPYQPLNFH